MVFFSPSISVSLIYTAIYSVAKAIYILHRYDLSNELTLTQSAGSLVGFVGVMFLFFYLVHKRELDRCTGQNNAVKKEQQVSHVLDSSTDSIVVVEKMIVEKILELNRDKHIDDEESKAPDVPKV